MSDLDDILHEALMKSVTILPDCMAPDGADPCKAFQEQQAAIDKYRTALTDICKHMESVAGGMVEMSTVWYIANKALGDE